VLSIPIKYEPEHHEVMDIPFTSFLRRHFSDPLLMTYRHRGTGNWIVGQWLDGEKKGQILELENLGPEPVGNKKVVKSIERMVQGSPGHAERKAETKHRLGNMDKDLINERIRDQEIEQDLLQHLRSRVKPSSRRDKVFAPVFNEPEKLVTGYTPLPCGQ